MRRLFAAPAAFFAAAALLTSLTAPPAAAQPAPPAEESFLTADGVQLKGLFHPATKAGVVASAAPVVVLLYPPGPDRDMTKGDWAGLATRLNDEGYHVFRFDWRGHGKSTEIKDTTKFWGNNFLNGNGNFNSLIKDGPPKRPVKNTLSVTKDLPGTKAGKYLPAYLNDLAAVRVHLDGKNDNKDLNTSSIYLIGAGDATALGMAWMTAEWQRPAVFPNQGLLGVGVPAYEFVPQGLNAGFTEAGADFAGAVWLSASRPTAVSEAVAKNWIARQAPKLRENNPMLFLFADKDQEGKAGSGFYFNNVLIGDPAKAKIANVPALDQTFIKDVKGGNQLSGVKLLGANKDLGTEDTIVKFLAAIQKERAKLLPKARKFDTPYYIRVGDYGLRP